MKELQRDQTKKSLQKIAIFFLILLILLVLAICYSHFITTKRLDVKEYKIISDKFSGSFHGYKIAHISDIHYGKTIQKEDFEKIIEKINLTKPDILIFTGDLIDKDTKVTETLLEEVEEILKKLDRSILKYEIKGEDDVLINNYSLIMENAGFVSLNDTYDTVYLDQENYLLLAGFKTRKENDNYDQKLENVTRFLIEQKENKPMYSIFIMHEPDMVENVPITDFDLLLAGHSHGGQIRLPKIGGLIYPKYAEHYHEAYEQIEGKDFYITSGIGTTTYGFRLFNNPSFNLYRMTSY